MSSRDKNDWSAVYKQPRQTTTTTRKIYLSQMNIHIKLQTNTRYGLPEKQ